MKSRRGLTSDRTCPDPMGYSTAGLTLDLTVAAEPLSQLLEFLMLDPITVSDDGGFLDRVAAQPNLPASIRTGLADFY